MAWTHMPVLRQYPYKLQKQYAGAPKSVPWEMVEPHRAQAMTNHGQTLERLAERGGLSPFELACVCTDTHWHKHREADMADHARWEANLLKLIEAWNEPETPDHA